MTQTQPNATAADLEPAPDFAVRDRSSLEWYIRTVSAKVREIETIKAQCAAMVKDVQREIDHLEFLYGHQARAVTEQLLEARRGNAKHIKTFFGNVGFRTTPARIQVRDAAQTIIWAQQHAPDLLETTLNKLALSRSFTVTPDGVVNADGERLEIPGVQITPSEERFYIRSATTNATTDDLE
jgi:phage host-nuclease inhibitor protein Gam